MFQSGKQTPNSRSLQKNLLRCGRALWTFSICKTIRIKSFQGFRLWFKMWQKIKMWISNLKSSQSGKYFMKIFIRACTNVSSTQLRTRCKLQCPNHEGITHMNCLFLSLKIHKMPANSLTRGVWSQTHSVSVNESFRFHSWLPHWTTTHFSAMFNNNHFKKNWQLFLWWIETQDLSWVRLLTGCS